MSYDFFQTVGGRDFIDNYLNLMERIVTALEHKNAAAAPSQLCYACLHYNNGSFHAVCRDCLTNGWREFHHIDDTEGPCPSSN